MAFATKYKIYVPDKDENRQATIEVQKDGYVGGITELEGNGECKISTSGTSGFLNIVTGRELRFGFHAEAADLATYDEFMEEDPGVMKVLFKPDGTNLEFAGYVQPANTTRPMAPHVEYMISATDGIANLRNLDYLNTDDTIFSDTTDKLTVIKRCLQLLNIDDCNFLTQINTYEKTLMTSTEDPLKEVDVDNRRFYSVQDGEQRPMKASDVLEEVLTELNCRIFQQEGNWEIVNDQEPDSFRVIYNYSTLAVDTARAARDRVVDISNKTNYPEFAYTTLGKVQPIKKLRIKFKNKNLGDNEVTNGDFSSGTTTGWNNGSSPNDWTVFTVTSEKLILTENASTGDPNVEKYFESDLFNINQGEGEGHFKYKFEIELADLEYVSGNYFTNPPYVRVRLIYPDLTFAETSNIIISEGKAYYFTENPNLFPLDQTGNYRLRIYYHPHSGADYNVISLKVDNIEVTQTATVNTSFDTVYIVDNANPGYREEEIDILFGDAAQTSDVGALKVAGTNTSGWERHGKTETTGIIELLGQQIINNHASIKDSRSFNQIDDPNNNIGYGTVIQIGSKKFVFHGNYEKDYRMNFVRGKAVELLNDDVSITTSIQVLTSVDGQSTTGIGETITAASYWLLAATGIYTSQNVGAGMVPTGPYDLEVNQDAWIGNDLTVIGSGTFGGGVILDSSDVKLDNQQHVQWKDTGGTYQNTIGVQASNVLWIGNTNLGDIRFQVGTLGQALLLHDTTGNAEFAGQVQTPATTATKAGLNVPHGTAPSSPADGDIWTTTTNLFARINGVTQTLTTPWVTSGNDIYYNTGNVAIGNTNFTGQLTLGTGGTGVTKLVLENGLGGTTFGLTLQTGGTVFNGGELTVNSAQDFYFKIGNTGAGNYYLQVAGLTASRAMVTDGSKNLSSSAVTSTELGYVSGVTSAIQTQLGTKALKATTISTQHSLTGGGDLSANRTLNLVGDTASPGNNKVYGTNASGVRGWYDEAVSSPIWSQSGSDIYYDAGNVGIGIIPVRELHIHKADSTNSYAHFTNTTTGTTTSDGFTIGLTAAEEVIVYNRENTDMIFGTNDTTRLTITAAGLVTVAGLTASRAMVTDASKNLSSSVTTLTELSHVSGVTSPIQNQLNGKEPTLTKGNLTASSPISLSATRQVIGGAAAISISQASTSTSGYLSSTDWNTFNDAATNQATAGVRYSVRKTSNQNISSTSFVDVTNLSFSVEAVSTYVFEAYIFIQGFTGDGNGISVAMNCTVSFTDFSYSMFVPFSATSSPSNIVLGWYGVGNDDGSVFNDFKVAGEEYIAHIHGIIRTDASPGTVKIRAKCENASQVPGIGSNSVLFYTKIS